MGPAFQKIKIPLAVIILIAIGFVAYTYFFKGSSKDPGASEVLESTATPQTSVSQEEQGFLALLLQIEKVKIDQTIFKNPVFISLHDDSPDLVDQPKGRLNPFAPIGIEEGSFPDTTTSSSSATLNLNAPPSVNR